MGLIRKHPGDKIRIAPAKIWGFFAVFFLFTGVIFSIAERRFELTARAKSISDAILLGEARAQKKQILPSQKTKENMDDLWCPPPGGKLNGFTKICGAVTSLQIESMKYQPNFFDPSSDTENNVFYTTGEFVAGVTVAVYESIPGTLNGKYGNGNLGHLFASTETNADGWWRLMMRKLGPKNGDVWLVALCDGKRGSVQKVKSTKYLSSIILSANCPSAQEKRKFKYKTPPPKLVIVDRSRFLECVTDAFAELLEVSATDPMLDPLYVGFEGQPTTPSEARINEANFDTRYVSKNKAFDETNAEGSIFGEYLWYIFDPSLKSRFATGKDAYTSALWSKDCEAFVKHNYEDVAFNALAALQRAGVNIPDGNGGDLSMETLLKLCKPEFYEDNLVRNAMWHLPLKETMPAYRTIENRTDLKGVVQFPNAINRLLCYAFGCTAGQDLIQQPVHVYEAGKIAISGDDLDSCEKIEQGTSAVGNPDPTSNEAQLDNVRLTTSFGIRAQTPYLWDEFDDAGLSDTEDHIPLCKTSREWDIPQYGISIPEGATITCGDIKSDRSGTLRALFGRPECFLPGRASSVMTTTYRDDSDACSQAEDKIRQHDFELGNLLEGYAPCKTQTTNIVPTGTNSRNSGVRAEFLVGPEGGASDGSDFGSGYLSMFESPYEDELQMALAGPSSLSTDEDPNSQQTPSVPGNVAPTTTGATSPNKSKDFSKTKAEFIGDLGAYAIQQCGMNDSMRYVWNTIEEHPLVRTYDYASNCIKIFEDAYGITNDPYPFEQYCADVGNDDVACQKNGGHSQNMPQSSRKKCSIARWRIQNVIDHSANMFLGNVQHVDGKSAQTGIFQTEHAGNRDRALIKTPLGNFPLFLAAPQYGLSESIGGANISRDFLDTLLRAAAWSDRVDISQLDDQDAMNALAAAAESVMPWKWGTKEEKSFLDRKNGPAVGGSNNIPVEYTLHEGNYKGAFPALRFDGSSIVGNGYPGNHGDMPWRDIGAGDYCAVHPGVGKEPWFGPDGEDDGMRSCRVKKDNGCFRYARILTDNEEAVERGKHCGDAPGRMRVREGGDWRTIYFCNVQRIDAEPCNDNQIVRKCLQPQQDTTDCAFSKGSGQDRSRSDCYEKHIDAKDACKGNAAYLGQCEPLILEWYYCDLQRPEYKYIAPLNWEYKATLTQEKSLEDGRESLAQSPIDSWATKMCDIAAAFNSPYGSHICNKVVSLADFECSHCLRKVTTFTGVDNPYGMGGESKQLYRASMSPSGNKRTKPYKEIVYHCDLKMPNGAEKPPSDKEILPIGGGETLSESEKKTYPTGLWQFSKFSLQWRKKIPIDPKDGPITWACPIYAFVQCSSNNPYKEKYFGEYSGVSTEAETQLRGKLILPEVVSVYAQVEKETGLACEVIAGIHFAEGGNNDYQSLFDGHQINPSELLADARGAIEHFLSRGGVPKDFEALMKALSEYNNGGASGGNMQCAFTNFSPKLTNWSHCPPEKPYMDDVYVTNLLSSVYTNMAIIWPMDSTRADAFCGLCKVNGSTAQRDYPTLCSRCGPPIVYDKPGAYTAALYFYLNGFFMSGEANLQGNIE